MNVNTDLPAKELLNLIISKPLVYAIKSPDTELYDFGFGDLVPYVGYKYESRKISMYTLHSLCRFVLIDKVNNKKKKFYEDTPVEQFQQSFTPLLGKCVKRIALSEKNDLWIDFSEYWVVFASFENSSESWRFFSADRSLPHLVASNTTLELIY